MNPERKIPEDLLGMVIAYIGQGSLSKSLTFAEVQIILQRLQTLEPVDDSSGQANTPHPGDSKA